MANNSAIGLLLGIGALYLIAKRSQPVTGSPTPPAAQTPLASPHVPSAAAGSGGGGIDTSNPGGQLLRAYWPSYLSPFDDPFFTEYTGESYREQYPVGPGVIDASNSEQ